MTAPRSGGAASGGGEQQQHRSTIPGASANLINAIVGAGIVGIPFAIRQSGLVAGSLLVVTVSVLAEKSLRMLVGTARVVGVRSYEGLLEAAFGRTGFLFVSTSMALLAYGSMVTYLMIVEDTIPAVIGMSTAKQKRAVLVLISVLVIVPLSCQRDMADLSRTSRINVLFDCIMVALVVRSSPVAEKLQEEDGGSWYHAVSRNTLRLDTVAVGLGVLSFAFVCQHSAFLIAGSLPRVDDQWHVVTKIGLTVCGSLALCNGLWGYLGYREETDGNILNNLGTDASATLARALLGCTMLLVYPVESFVCRHACVALLFHRGRKGQTQQDDVEDDVWTFLNCTGRRVGLTVTLYILALLPALLFNDLGKVLAVTGTIGGSLLSYIGPGSAFLGVHGERFLDIAGCHGGANNDLGTGDAQIPPLRPPTLGSRFLWYLFLMPLWCGIAKVGQNNVEMHRRTAALVEIELKTGRPSDSSTSSGSEAEVESQGQEDNNNDNGISPLIEHGNSEGKDMMEESGSVELEDGMESEMPSPVQATMWDFVIAIGYILFGLLALSLGLFSIALESEGTR